MTRPSRTRTAAFLIIGNEILSGRTKDINLNHLARKLRSIGINLRETRVVRDEEDAIVRAVREMSAIYDLVFTSGGIGPTHDDITTASIAKAFNAEVRITDEARQMLEDYYSKRGQELTPAHLKMASTPEGAVLIANKLTGAPAYRVNNVHVLAGVPQIFASMLDEVLEDIGKAEGYHSRTVQVMERESLIAELLAEVQNSHPELDVGSYPQMKDGKYCCELVVSGLNRKSVEEAFGQLVKALQTSGFRHAESPE